MAPGVGKTYEMLHEGRRRKDRSTDVVIGLVETHGRPRTTEVIGDLEIVPHKRIEYKGVTLEEMDMETVIRRKPQVALVDELAHTNAPSSKNDKRRQDVEELLDAGITVFSTVNVQHLELADIVESITGVLVREHIPDRIITDADEIELVDMSPNALRHRMAHGNVYPPERTERALEGFFREGNLNALRDLALRKVATAVEEDLEDHMRGHNMNATWATDEQVMVCVDSQAEAQHLVRRAWRIANAAKTDLLAVFVETPRWARASPDEWRILEENLRFAEDLGAEVMRVKGSDVAAELARVAREKNVGSVVIGHSRRGRLQEMLNGSDVTRLLRRLPNVDVHVVAQRDPR